MFNARCRIRVHYSLPQLKQVFVSSTFRSLSQKHGFSPGSGCCQEAAPSPPWSMLKRPQECGDGMGQSCPLTSPPDPIPLSLLQSQGRKGLLSLPDQKFPLMKSQEGDNRPALGLGLQSSTASGTGPSWGSNPLLPAPLTEKTLLLLQFRQLSQTSEVRWYK